MSLSIEYRPLSSLVPADRNPKEHNIEGIKLSLRTLGVADYVGMVDGRTGKLLGGHGRVEALTQMHMDGEEPPEGVRVYPLDEGDPTKLGLLVPVLIGFESRDDQHAEAVIIALNQHTITGGWDAPMLAEMMAGLPDAITPETLGFTPDALDDLFAQLDELGFAGDQKSGGFAATGGGARSEPSMKERKDEYAGSTIRSLVLDYPLTEFEEVIGLAGHARLVYQVESNSELFLKLLRLVGADVVTDEPEAEYVHDGALPGDGPALPTTMTTPYDDELASDAGTASEAD